MLLRMLAMVLIASTQGGCLLTTHMWNDAKNEFATNPHVAVIPPNAASHGRTQVIYEVAGINTATYLLFNIPAELEANYAFEPKQWLRQSPTTLAYPAPSREDAIRYAKIASLALPDECFVRTISYSEMQKWVAASPAKWVTRDPRGTPIREDVRVFMTSGFVGTPHAGATVGLADGEDITITPETKFLAVPHLQRRPKREQNAAKVRAAILTPLTIVGDIVLAPVYLVLLLNLPKC